MSEHAALVASFQVPLIRGHEFKLDVEIGKTIFVLGANGSGKSALLYFLHGRAGGDVKWIQAHRRSWLSSNAPMRTSTSLHEVEQSHISGLLGYEARYRQIFDDFYGDEAITALINRQNADARATHNAVRNGDPNEIAKRLRARDVLMELNSILRQSNIRLTIDVGPRDDLIARRDGLSYGVDQMSDGERNAFLLVSNVLTAPAETLFLIDEPETHLHHSIASPLLSRLFAFRADCSFVVAVHQVALPMDNSEAAVLLLRGCAFDGKAATKWDLDFIESTQTIPEDIRATILGARRIVVFVEGGKSSLDYPFYATVLPGASVIPVGGSQSVIGAVQSMRAAADHHHIRCFGVIDRDHRRSDDLDSLSESGIFVVDGYSVESIYYDERMQRMVVKRNARSDADRLLGRAKEAALEALSARKKTMCSLSASAKIRQSFLHKLHDTDWEHDDSIEVPAHSVLNKEMETFQAALNERDLDLLIRQYPVKKSAALDRIAKGLGFRNCEAYERSVVTLLQDDDTALRYVRQRFSDLLTAIEHGQN